MGKVFLKKYPEIRQQATQAGEQQAIRQIQQRGTTQVDGSAQSGDTGAGVQLSNEQMAMAKALGVNPQDYAKRIKK
jgi:phage I-like protein